MKQPCLTWYLEFKTWSLMKLGVYPFGAGPIVPPSTNSALIIVWRVSSFPSLMLLTQLTMRFATERLLQRIYETDGRHSLKCGSSSTQTKERSRGTRMPRLTRKLCVAK